MPHPPDQPHGAPPQGGAPQGSLIRGLGRFWTAANVLTLTRFVLIAPITYLVWIDGPLSWLFALVGVAILTDFFDGRLARWSGTVSDWGKVLDPLADKAGGVAVVTALTFRPHEPTLPVWLLALLVVRDTLIVLGAIRLTRRTGTVFMSLYAGKIAVTALAVTVLAVLFKADPPVLVLCIWATAALLVLSFFLYLGRYLRHRRAHPVAPSPSGEAAPPAEELR